MNFQLTPLSKFIQNLACFCPSLPRQNSSTDLPSELPAELLSAPLVWVRWGGLVLPLQPLYDGPYAVLRRGPCSFTIRVRSQDKVVAVSRLKACMASDAKPGSPRCHGRLPGSRPGGLAATKRVLFSDPLVSLPSPSLMPLRDGPGTVFLPGEEVFAQPPQTRYPSRQWTSDLFSSQLRPELTSTGLNSMTTAGQRGLTLNRAAI
jgi:hypothetical protein